MKEQDRAELERLRRQQEALQVRVSSLQLEIERLAERLSAELPRAANALQPEVPPQIAPAPILQPITDEPHLQPPPLPVVEPVILQSQSSAPEFEPEPLEPVSPQQAESAPRVRESFEMKLGTYWLVRIGIVMLLTGLVFLGTYAYKNYIGRLGPAGKVTLLYSVGAVLLACGGWLQRKREKESVRNYGQVLFAGGLATVYFTTYAAHYLDALRIIASPTVDALLLLAWSAVIVWIADRRKSEVLALFAIGLSYYTSAITDVGLFTLCSNLLLTMAAVFFLIRNRWTTLSFISLVATYAGFAFWRFHQGDWTWAARTTELWPANFFMAGYWLLFTVAVFCSRASTLVNVSRALLASVNNAAFFGLVLLSMLHVAQGHFWKFSLSFGSILLIAAALARELLPEEPATKNTYIVQGLVLVTLGFIAYFTGLKLALVLAAESVVLLFLGQVQKNHFVRAGGYVAAALCTAWMLAKMTPGRSDVVIGATIAAAFILSAWWEHRHDQKRGTAIARPFSGYFVALALAVCGSTTWHVVPPEWRTVAWMIEAVALTALFYIVRVPELPLFSQVLALAAQGLWFFEFALRQNKPHWIVPATLVSGTLALSHWWQRQKRIVFDAHARNILQIVYGLAFVGVLFFWFQPKFAPAAWLGFLCLLSIAVTIYGVATRAWALAACAQMFLLVSSAELLHLSAVAKPAWHFAIIPILTWLALGTATTAWLAHFGVREELRRPMLHVSTFYQAIAVIMSVWWVFTYVPQKNQFWTFCAVGLAILAVAGALRHREALAFAAVFFSVGFATWFLSAWTSRPVMNWPNGLAIVALLLAQQVVRRMSERFPLHAHIHSAFILLSGTSLWLFVSRWVVITAGTHFLLTVSWAIVAAALFATGFVLRDRMHRWIGLGILACAVTRVFASDVWKLETIYRILSFTALGLVLLALGFVYNKYQDKIRQWL